MIDETFRGEPGPLNDNLSERRVSVCENQGRQMILVFVTGNSHRKISAKWFYVSKNKTGKFLLWVFGLCVFQWKSKEKSKKNGIK